MPLVAQVVTTTVPTLDIKGGPFPANAIFSQTLMAHSLQQLCTHVCVCLCVCECNRDHVLVQVIQRWYELDTSSKQR